MIKTNRYTLIELLAAMTIFIIMMGILFKTFTTSADVASRETTKVGILSDANVFFTYITNDLKSMIVDIYPAPENENGVKDDPDSATATVDDYGDSQLKFTTTSIECYSNVTPYNETTLVTALGSNSPYIKYELNSEKIYRTMASDSGGSDSVQGIILEGVTDFSIKLWDDYPGGNELTTSPTSSKPACITVSVTLTSPNPNMSTQLKEKEKRTITKTIYMKR